MALNSLFCADVPLSGRDSCVPARLWKFSILAAVAIHPTSA